LLGMDEERCFAALRMLRRVCSQLTSNARRTTTHNRYHD
jgi:hypothetical protein